MIVGKKWLLAENYVQKATNCKKARNQRNRSKKITCIKTKLLKLHVK